MASTTTLNETGRTLDYSEYVRLATAGANWKAQLSTITREKLAANRTYYVRTDGSDSNTGLVDSAGGAFLTIQKAVDTVVALDHSIYASVIQVASGTYAGAVSLAATNAAPLNASLLCASGTATISHTNGLQLTGAGCSWTLGGGAGTMKFTTSGTGIQVAGVGSVMYLAGGIEFGACTNYHMFVGVPGGQIYSFADYTVTGASGQHHFATAGGNITIQNTVTLSGALAFTTFAYANDAGTMQAGGSVYTGGTITGQRYSASLNAVIDTQGGGANFFPGDSAGATATGGQYA